MDILSQKFLASLCVLFLFFLSSFQFVHSLSTFSISQISNQTEVCGLVQSLTNQQPYLNCSSFPQGIQIPAISSLQSVSGVVGGDDFLCALSTFESQSTSILVCWRFSQNGNNNSTSFTFRRIYQGPVIRELSAGNSQICGVVAAGNGVQCWQWPGFRSVNGSLITSEIAVGENFVCGLTESSRVQCLGSFSNVTERAPAGNFSVVAAGSRQACAIAFNGSLECWGDTVGEEPPSGEFKAVAIGEQRSCALTKTNGTVVCWGDNSGGGSIIPVPESLLETSFLSLEAKGEVFCGVTTLNLSLVCWGNDQFDSNSAVFFNQTVLPGPCRNECPCGILPNSGSYCGGVQRICEPCFGVDASGESPPSITPSMPPATPPGDDDSRFTRALVAFLVVGCVGSLSLILVLTFLFFRYCKIRGSRIHDSGNLDEAGMPGGGGGGQASRQEQSPPAVLEKRLSQLISLGTGGNNLEDFDLETLLLATDNFSEENKIGSGSFGTVYRGRLEDGREVAIKRAEVSSSSSYGGATKRGGQEDKDSAFLTELEFLSRLNHRNLVRLLGYCDESDERVLVYEYMDNGTLHDHLHSLENSPLMSWPARIKVALDAARGVEYLHEYAVPPIIHRDIKSSNILLDSTWTAKVSDFGLSLMGPEDDVSHLSLRAAGTVGYMDPEYYRLQQLTTKSDVYSFGVVLLELLSGQKAIHKNENGVPRNVVDYMVQYIIQDEIHRALDRRLPPPTPFEIEAVAYVGYLAADCVTLEGRSRPSMSEIVNSLEKALAACLAPPTFSRSSTDSSS